MRSINTCITEAFDKRFTDVDEIVCKYLITGYMTKSENDKRAFNDFSAMLMTKTRIGGNMTSGEMIQAFLSSDAVDGIPEPIGNDGGSYDEKELWSLIHDKGFKIVK